MTTAGGDRRHPAKLRRSDGLERLLPFSAFGNPPSLLQSLAASAGSLSAGCHPLLPFSAEIGGAVFCCVGMLRCRRGPVGRMSVHKSLLPRDRGRRWPAGRMSVHKSLLPRDRGRRWPAGRMRGLDERRCSYRNIAERTAIPPHTTPPCPPLASLSTWCVV